MPQNPCFLFRLSFLSLYLCNSNAQKNPRLKDALSGNFCKSLLNLRPNFALPSLQVRDFPHNLQTPLQARNQAAVLSSVFF